MRWLKNIILAKYFLLFLFVFFTFQAVYYATFVGFGIPSDETYHFGSVQYYANQPITDGPFTHNQDPKTIPVLRTIDRDANYLSHYVLSWPDRVMKAMGLSDHIQIIILRFINIIFGLLSLLLIKKILDEISADKLARNFTLFLMVMTGMFVWVAGAINYDNMANLLFLLFLWSTIKITKKPDPLMMLFATFLSIATLLTKYTFAPVLLLGLILTAIFIWKNGYRPKTFWQDFLKKLKVKRTLTVLIVLANVLFLGLFIERIGINLVRYHSIQPDCTAFFTVDECRTMNVYNRNYNQKKVYTEADKSQLISNFDPFGFTGQWTYTMYNTLYFQLGDRRFESQLFNRIFAALLAVALIVTVFLSRRRIKMSKSAGYVLGISLFYVAVLFVYNLNTYFDFGQQYAFQGRYLLPVLAFLYFFTVLLVLSAYRSRKPRRRLVFAWAWLVVLILFFASHFPPYLLSRGTDASWRQDFILPKETID